MPLTATFIANPGTFLATRSVLVVEPIATANPNTTAIVANPHYAGNHYVIPTGTIHFSFAPMPSGGHTNTVVCNMHYAGAPVTAQPCYFLPYLPNAATTMVLGGAARHFFTSSLSGCTVQVFGPANAPTVTHGNAANTFKSHGAITAQTTINGLLPAPGGAVSRQVTRADYHGRVNALNFNAAKAAYPLPVGFRFDTLAQKTTTGGEPEVGAFVFGVCDLVGNWTFWYQTTLGVSGKIRTGYAFWAEDKPFSDELVLGAPVQLFP